MRPASALARQGPELRCPHRWLDGTPRPMNPHPGFNSSGGYMHWGYYMPQNIIEPNDFIPHEHCVGANYTEAWDNAWGWADTNCYRKFPALCMAQGACKPLSTLILRLTAV